MKKQILMAFLLGLIMLMISGVFADYSIRGSQDIKEGSWIYKASFSAWHNDGRQPSFVNGRLSNGISPSGKGTLSLSAWTNEFKGSISLKLDETSSTIVGNKIYVQNSGKGILWYRGIFPMPISANVQYVYDLDNKIVSLSSDQYPGMQISIPVK